MRWREPRLRRLARIEPDTRVSASYELSLRASETPGATFFMWRGRAFSYLDADVRVTNVARGLYACGVRRGERVGVVMASRPSLLSACTALGRLGAISVLAPGENETRAEVLQATFARLGVRRVLVDPERRHLAENLGVEVLVLGGGGAARSIESKNVRDLEAIDPGRARDVAHVLLRPSENESRGTRDLRAVPVTNHRWGLSAVGAAAACAVKPGDTVFCAVPLHHPTGMLVSVGAALAGGARLALVDLTDRTAPDVTLDARRRLLLEIRRVGATVVFYAGEMLRPLVTGGDEPMSHADRHLPVRVFAGSGMRKDLAAHLRETYRVDTMEFYAGTAHRAILADPDADEPGSLGLVLPGSADVALARCDLTKGAPVLDTNRHLIVADTDEPALLAVKVTDEDIETLADVRGVTRDAFGDGSHWLVTNDVVRRDSAGRHWFVDALSGFVVTKNGEPASLRAVEDALYALPEVRLACAWDDGANGIGAAYVASAPIAASRLGEALAALPEHARPASVARVMELPLTEGFRPSRRDAKVRGGESRERWINVGSAYAPGEPTSGS